MLLERIKYILFLAFFLFLLGLSIKVVNDGDARVGWAGGALWATMSALTTYYMIRDCYTSEGKARFMEKARAAKAEGAKSKSESLKAHLVTIWTTSAAVLIGLASNLVTEKIEGRLFPSIAAWLGSFFFTLLFYPFQKRQKDGVDDFAVWAVYSALMGGVSVVCYFLKGWLR